VKLMEWLHAKRTDT